MAQHGSYVVIEGTDATGKSTQAEILAERLMAVGHEVVQFHEPDGVAIAHELRKIIKNGTFERSALTNVLLFTAARRENWRQQGLPVLERGGFIVAARNYYSTLAYQGIAEGIGYGSEDEALAYIEKLTREATDERYMIPDYAVMLDIDDEVERKRRIAERGEPTDSDTFESRGSDFQQQVIHAYRSIARRKQIPVISATQAPDAVADELWQAIQPLMKRA